MRSGGSVYKYVHLQFVNQDRRQIEAETYRSPEKLSATDVGLILWRRFAAKIARQPQVANVAADGCTARLEPQAEDEREQVGQLAGLHRQQAP